MEPLINILCRSHRPALFRRMEQSVKNCGYENIILHVYDGTGKGDNFEYNLLCNDLKAEVKRGYFFFLDDDDTLLPGALSAIAPHLKEDAATIVPFLRNGRPKPRRAEIVRGKCGLPNLILHSKHAALADVTAHAGGDYDWIKSVTDQIPWQFINIPLVDSPKRSYGK